MKSSYVVHARGVLAIGFFVLFGSVAAEAWAQGTGNGLVAEYYNTNNFTGNRVAVDFSQAPINFVWGGAPRAGVNADNFTVRYRGQLEILTAESVTFFTTQDDQSRLYIDGTLILTNTAVGVESSATVANMTVGKHDIMLEFIEFGGNATILLQWQSPSIVKAPIPATALYSPTVIPAVPTITPNGGICPVSNIQLSPIPAGGSIYYTVNGTDPGVMNPQTNASAILFTAPFTVNSYLKIRARAYNPGPTPLSSDLLLSADFSPQFAPLTPPGNIVPQLYFREYFSPTGSLIPNYPPLIPRQRGLAPRPTHLVPPMPVLANNDSTNFSYLFQGYINIPTDGMWTFWTTSDDGSRMYIDGNLVVENNFAQGATARSGQIALTTGFHSIAVPYAQGGGGFSLFVEWQGPSGSNPARQTIPDGNYFTEPIVTTPGISPNGGTFVTSQVVTLTCPNPGSTIFYTTDGSFPDPSLSNGSGPSGTTLTLTQGATVRALAVAPGMNTSAIASATFRSPPKPLSAVAAAKTTEVILQFDRPVDEATASLPANYSINNGITVSAAAPLDRATALLGYWKMDDATPASPSTGTDSSGNNNAGTVTTGTQDTTNRPFTALVNPGSANASSLAFNGTTTTFVVNDSASLNVGLGSFTAAAWIRTANAGATQHIIGKWDTANNGLGWFLDLQGGGALRFRMRDPQGRNFDFTTTSAPVNTAGPWYHVAVRVDKLLCRVSYFVNGQQIGGPVDADSNMDLLTSTVQLGIGSSPTIGGSFFSGQIDDVRLYKAALTNNEVAALAGFSDHVASSVKLTTSALAAATTYTMTIRNVADPSGMAIPAAGVTIPFRFFPTGNVVHERYDNIGGGTLITDMSRNAIFPNAPTQGTLIATVETPTNAADNYGGRVRGYFIAPSTSSFKFALATDDGGKFFISTNEDPANMVQVSRCNVWAPVRGYTDPDCLQSGPIPMVSGQKYYFEAYFKEGGGGDNLAVAVKVDDGTAIADNTLPIGDPANTVASASSIAPYVEPMVNLDAMPNISEAPGRSVTFTAPVQGTQTGVFTLPQGTRYQWQKNGVNIPGANAATFTIGAIAPADAAAYSVIVSNSVNNATTNAAQLILVDDPHASLSPNAGPIAGGVPVTVAGENFVPGLTSVSFGGANAGSVVVLNSTSLTCMAPAHAAGAVLVQITGGTETQTLETGFTYYGPPTITPPLAPNVGPLTGRSGIVITGTGYAPGQTTVVFGGTPAINVSVAVNGLSLTCDAPAHAAGVVDVVLTTPGGTVTSSGAFTYYPIPTIATPLLPNAGPLTGTAGVSINGSGFAVGLSTVTFGGAAATNVTVSPGGTSLTCNAPAHAAGTVDVVIVTPGGSVTAAAAFSYVPVPTIAAPLNPTAGPLAGFAGVVLNGTDFVPGQTAVSFGGTAATNANVSPGGASLSCDAPAHASAIVDIVVTTPGGTAVATAAFTYYGVPTITVPLNPNAGPLGGLAGITINGTGFAPGLTTVSIGGTAATGVSVQANGTSLLCDAAAHAAGTFDVVVTTPGGTATAPAAFIYYDVPAILPPLNPGSGRAQGGETISITGTNFAPGQTVVTFGGAQAASVNVSSSTTLTLVTPGHDAATVTVVVTTPGGTTALTNGFTFVGPRIASVSPTAGPLAGGQTVVLQGSGFIPASTITIGTKPATISSVTATSITLTAPVGSTVGPADVTLTNSPTENATLPGGYFYVGAPTVTGAALNQGPLSGGQTVTITGSSFAPGLTTVAFGTAAASNVSVSAGNTTLTCTTPGHAAGPVAVSVTTFGNQTATLAAGYTYVDPPTVLTLVPSRGSTAGGQLVAVSGSHFVAGQTLVEFGLGNAATGVNVINGTTLTCLAPPHAAGTVDLVVTTFALQSGTRAGAFTYVSPATSVNLSLTMTVDTPTTSLGEPVTFTLTLTNSGGVNATGVAVADLIPSGLTFVSAAPSTGTYDPSLGRWTAGTVNTGASATLLLVAQVNTSATIVNVAEVSACDQPDINSTPANGVPGEDDMASVAVTAGLTILTPGGALAAGTSGAFYSQQISAAGGLPVYAWSLLSAPATFPFNLDPATGRISGTAPAVSATSTFSFTLAVKDSQDPPSTSSRDYTVTISPPDGALPMISTSPAPRAGIVGTAYSHVFLATGGQPPYAWSLSAGALPAGLLLNPRTGELGGTPSTPAAAVGFTIQATSSTGSSAQPFSIAVLPNPVTLTTVSLADGSVGAPYTQVLALSGGIGPAFAWSTISGVLPPGLLLSGSGRTAVISGTPTTAGSSTFTIRASDNGQAGVSDTQVFTIRVLPATTAFSITTSALPDGNLGRPYNFTLSAIGGTPPYTWNNVSGNLPPGMLLNASSGLITGSSSMSGSFAFLLQAGDSSTSTRTDVRSLVLTILPPPRVTTEELPATVVNEGYAASIEVVGGTPPYSWSISSGGLPPGLSLSSASGVISGTAVSSATATFTVTVTDVSGVSGNRTLMLIVLNPAGGLAVLDGLPAGQLGVPYSASLKAISGTSPLTWSLASGTMPAWSTLDTTTGTIYGTPTLAAASSLQFRVTDSSVPAPATSTSAFLTLTIDAPVQILQARVLPAAATGSSYSTMLTASGAVGSVQWTLVDGTLPPGILLDSSSGNISGMAVLLGTYDFSIRATDSNGRTDQQVMTLSVVQPGVAPPPPAGGGGGKGGGCGARIAVPDGSSSESQFRFFAALIVALGCMIRMKGRPKA